jgi:transposase
MLTRRRIAATIPERADQLANRRRKGRHGGRLRAFDPATYKRRNVLGRCFNRFKQWRAVASVTKRKPSVNYRAGIVLASVILWLKT